VTSFFKRKYRLYCCHSSSRRLYVHSISSGCYRMTKGLIVSYLILNWRTPHYLNCNKCRMMSVILTSSFIDIKIPASLMYRTVICLDTTVNKLFSCIISTNINFSLPQKWCSFAYLFIYLLSESMINNRLYDLFL
jgi:hypothetical protein